MVLNWTRAKHRQCVVSSGLLWDRHSLLPYILMPVSMDMQRTEAGSLLSVWANCKMRQLWLKINQVSFADFWHTKQNMKVGLVRPSCHWLNTSFWSTWCHICILLKTLSHPKVCESWPLEAGFEAPPCSLCSMLQNSLLTTINNGCTHSLSAFKGAKTCRDNLAPPGKGLTVFPYHQVKTAGSL